MDNVRQYMDRAPALDSGESVTVSMFVRKDVTPTDLRR